MAGIIAFLICLGIGMITLSIIASAHNDKRLGFILFFFIMGLVLVGAGAFLMKSYTPPIKEETVKCTEIKQIDTLFKNDSIIGYEITYIKD